MKKIFELINKNCLVSRFVDLWNKKTPPSKALPLITISREKGSGGRIIAFSVAKKLGKPWKVFHKEIVEEIAREARLEKALISEVDESHVPFIDEIIADFFGRRYLNLTIYHKHLVKVLSTIGQRGYAIVIGRGANFLFPYALKVRIIGEMDQRIKWLMEFDKIVPYQKALEKIIESDCKRREFNQRLFHHDVKKPHHFDLTIRTGGNLSIEDAANLIVLLAKKRFNR